MLLLCHPFLSLSLLTSIMDRLCFRLITYVQLEISFLEVNEYESTYVSIISGVYGTNQVLANHSMPHTIPMIWSAAAALPHKHTICSTNHHCCAVKQWKHCGFWLILSTFWFVVQCSPSIFCYFGILLSPFRHCMILSILHFITINPIVVSVHSSFREN